MKIDKNTIGKIREMSDSDLREAISKVASAIGADDKQRQRALNNLKTVRKKLNNASERDIQNAVGKIGEEKAEEILRDLKL